MHRQGGGIEARCGASVEHNNIGAEPDRPPVSLPQASQDSGGIGCARNSLCQVRRGSTPTRRC